VRRRARFNVKCKAENEKQEQNARAGGKESNKISAGPVSSQIESIDILNEFVNTLARLLINVLASLLIS
jgi:hypothetical protein